MVYSELLAQLKIALSKTRGLDWRLYLRDTGERVCIESRFCLYENYQHDKKE